MGRVLRIAGIAVLIAASLNATAGLCFCQRGPDAPVSQPGGQACCHCTAAADRLALSAVRGCCHIESAQRDMTPVGTIHLAQPVTSTGVDLVLTANGRVSSPSAVLASSASPPILTLRL